MEKRVLFRSRWLPWVLLMPQLVIIGVFFFWPASQAVLQSLQVQDAFGMSTEWVGLENFRNLLDDPTYLNSFQRTAFFSVLVAAVGIVVSLVLAIFADRIVRGALVYKTLLIVPYAVAPVIAGVLWIFMFSPSIGVVSYFLGKLGYSWNHLMSENQAMGLIVAASVWKQISYNFLFFLAGLQSIPKSLIEAASIDGAGPWRRFWNIQLPLLSPTTFFLLVINIVYAFFNAFDHHCDDQQRLTSPPPSGLGVSGRLQGARSGRIGGAVHCSDDHRGGLDVVQFRYIERGAMMPAVDRYPCP